MGEESFCIATFIIAIFCKEEKFARASETYWNDEIICVFYIYVGKSIFSIKSALLYYVPNIWENVLDKKRSEIKPSTKNVLKPNLFVK